MESSLRYLPARTLQTQTEQRLKLNWLVCLFLRYSNKAEYISFGRITKDPGMFG